MRREPPHIPESRRSGPAVSVARVRVPIPDVTYIEPNGYQKREQNSRFWGEGYQKPRGISMNPGVGEGAAAQECRNVQLAERLFDDRFDLLPLPARQAAANPGHVHRGAQLFGF